MTVSNENKESLNNQEVATNTSPKLSKEEIKKQRKQSMITLLVILSIIGIFLYVNSSKETTNINKIIDAQQFSNVSADKVKEVLGKPSDTDKWNWTIPSMGEEIPAITYAYDNPNSDSYELMMVKGKVIRFTYNCETQDLSKSSIEDICNTFGITYDSGAQLVANTGSALRYRNINDKIDEIWVVSGESNKCIVKITYDIRYFQ